MNQKNKFLKLSLGLIMIVTLMQPIYFANAQYTGRTRFELLVAGAKDAGTAKGGYDIGSGTKDVRGGKDPHGPGTAYLHEFEFDWGPTGGKELDEVLRDILVMFTGRFKVKFYQKYWVDGPYRGRMTFEAFVYKYDKKAGKYNDKPESVRVTGEEFDSNNRPPQEPPPPSAKPKEPVPPPRESSWLGKLVWGLLFGAKQAPPPRYSESTDAPNSPVSEPVKPKGPFGVEGKMYEGGEDDGGVGYIINTPELDSTLENLAIEMGFIGDANKELLRNLMTLIEKALRDKIEHTIDTGYEVKRSVEEPRKKVGYIETNKGRFYGAVITNTGKIPITFYSIDGAPIRLKPGEATRDIVYTENDRVKVSVNRNEVIRSMSVMPKRQRSLAPTVNPRLSSPSGSPPTGQMPSVFQTPTFRVPPSVSGYDFLR